MSPAGLSTAVVRPVLGAGAGIAPPGVLNRTPQTGCYRVHFGGILVRLGVLPGGALRWPRDGLSCVVPRFHNALLGALALHGSLLLVRSRHDVASARPGPEHAAEQLIDIDEV